MIRCLLSRLSRRPPDIRREVTVLITLYGPEGAWLEARDRWRVAREDARWRGSQLLRRRGRYWNSVMREIERQSGYSHQPDTATRYLDTAEEERRRKKNAVAAERRRRSH